MLLQQKQQAIFFSFMMVFAYMFAWVVQDELFINSNVGYLLNASRLLLQGGNYTNDFFTPHSPILLFLYLPVVVASKLFDLDIVPVFQGYVFSLCTFSLTLCWLSVKKIVINDMFLSGLLMFVLACVLLLLPVYDFGQSDHLLLLLTMPYLLLVAVRLNDETINDYAAVIIGVMAGAAAAIKPQFLLTPILMESCYICWKNKWNTWMRIETFALICVLLSSVLITLIFFQDYLRIVLPFHLRNYYSVASASWIDMTLSPLALFCLLAVPLYFACLKKNNYQALSAVLLVGLGGFLLAFYFQRSLSYCHLLAPLSAALLLFSLLFYQLFQQPELNRQDSVYLALIMLAFLFVNYSLSFSAWTNLVFFPGVFYAFFSVLLCALLYLTQRDKNMWVVMPCVIVIMTACYLFTRIFLPPMWHLDAYIIAFMLLIILYAGCAWQFRGKLTAHAFIGALSMLVFFIPTIQGFYRFNEGIAYKEKTVNQLVEFMRTQPSEHKTFYVLSSSVNYSIPLEYYANSVSVQRFDRLPKNVQCGKDRKLVIDMVVDDLHRSKPDLIFVDASDVNLNYLTDFIGDQNFRDEWKSYQYLTTIRQGNSAIPNQLQVYRRIMN